MTIIVFWVSPLRVSIPDRCRLNPPPLEKTHISVAWAELEKGGARFYGNEKNLQEAKWQLRTISPEHRKWGEWRVFDYPPPYILFRSQVSGEPDFSSNPRGKLKSKTQRALLHLGVRCPRCLVPCPSPGPPHPISLCLCRSCARKMWIGTDIIWNNLIEGVLRNNFGFISAANLFLPQQLPFFKDIHFGLWWSFLIPHMFAIKVFGRPFRVQETRTKKINDRCREMKIHERRNSCQVFSMCRSTIIVSPLAASCVQKGRHSGGCGVRHSPSYPHTLSRT